MRKRRSSSTRRERRALSLSTRLLATYVMLVLATLLAVAGLSIHLSRLHLNRQLDARLAATAESFANGPARRTTTHQDLVTETARWLAAQGLPDDQVVAVRLPNGPILTASTGLDLNRLPQPADLLYAGRSRWWELRGTDGYRIRALSVPVILNGSQHGTLVTAASPTELTSTLGVLVPRIAVATAVGVAFAGLLAFGVIRRTLRPLVRFSRDVESIRVAGDLSRRVVHDGPGDEVGRLAGAFNHLLSRLQESFRSQQRFISDASHELRTPLTVARGRLELLADAITNQWDRRSLSQVMEELDRMRHIVDDLLLLARLEEGVPLERRPVEVELVLREALLRGLLVGPRDAKVDAEPDLYALADPERLLRALTNLVANAVRHAGPHAFITLASSRYGKWARIIVSDTGRGILPHDLPHVFDRLYRGTKAQINPADGAGLGLPIAASIVRAMGGAIDIRSAPGQGTTVTVDLPRVEQGAM